MKKIIAVCLALAVVSWLVGPALVVANGTVGTGLSRGTGGGSIPGVKAKWEMKGSCFDGQDYIACPGVGEGKDDSTNAGAQFNPTNQWDTYTNYTVCAVATDPDGVADISGVYADIYYPANKAIHDKTPSTDLHRDPDVGAKDEGVGGCSAFIEQNTLIKLDKVEGYHLFCEVIQDTNNNLPVFFGYGYGEICGATGELMKETAYVYCDDKKLKWEDPAGLYKVDVTAQDKSGNSSILKTNNFEYLPLTGFEKDFTSIAYGTIMLNTHKRIAGDTTFTTANLPTIRNTGNTRLWMKVAQDDMGLGQSSGVWNVGFDARVGNNEADWTNYNPFGLKGTSPGTYTQLEDILDLSEAEEMDFSILVKKWPDTNTNYTGTMWLGATNAPFRICGTRI